MKKFKKGQRFDPSFTEISPEEIMIELTNASYKIEERTITKELTPKELTQREHEFSELGIQLAEIAAERKETLAEFKEQARIPKTRSEELVELIKHKSEQIEAQVFLIDDRETQIMYIFDSSGICLESRPIQETEIQLKINPGGEQLN